MPMPLYAIATGSDFEVVCHKDGKTALEWLGQCLENPCFVGNGANSLNFHELPNISMSMYQDVTLLHIWEGHRDRFGEGSTAAGFRSGHAKVRPSQGSAFAFSG